MTTNYELDIQEAIQYLLQEPTRQNLVAVATLQGLHKTAKELADSITKEEHGLRVLEMHVASLKENNERKTYER